MKHKEFIEQAKKEWEKIRKGGSHGIYAFWIPKLTQAIENYREEMRLKGIGIGREDGGGYGKAHLEIEKKDKEYFL